MSKKFGEALREKFKDHREVLRALGLDEDIILEEGISMTAKPTKFANTALQLTAAVIKPLLAKDAKIDLMPIFAGVTSKNFKPKEIKLALDAALKGKLGKDAEPGMSHVAQMLDHIGTASDPKTADESVSAEQHKAMGAAAGGESELGIPKSVGEEFVKADKGKSFDASIEPLKAYLKEKGAADDVIGGACDMVRDMMPPTALDAEETSEEKEAREKKEKEAADKKAKDSEAALAEKNTKGEDSVSKHAMDAALAANSKQIRETERGIRVALQTVRPYVGELSETLAFDSADDVMRHALGMLGVPRAKEIKDSAALQTILSMHPKAGAKPVQRDTELGMDSAETGGFAERHPEASRIQTI
jgi:hypothetical protein